MRAEDVPDQLQGLLHEHDVVEDPALVEQHEQPLAHAAGGDGEALLAHLARGVGEGAPALVWCAVHVGHAPLALGRGLAGEPCLRLPQAVRGQRVRQQAVAAALQVGLAALQIGGESGQLGHGASIARG